MWAVRLDDADAAVGVTESHAGPRQDFDLLGRAIAPGNSSLNKAGIQKRRSKSPIGVPAPLGKNSLSA